MEPLDPKAELMRLARECGDIERRHCIGKAQGFDVRDAYIALESAITLALAAERRLAIEDAVKLIDTMEDYDGEYSTVIDRVRALIDGKASE